MPGTLKVCAGRRDKCIRMYVRVGKLHGGRQCAVENTVQTVPLAVVKRVGLYELLVVPMRCWILHGYRYVVVSCPDPRHPYSLILLQPTA